MPKLPRPARRIAPAEFYGTYLPQTWDLVRAGASFTWPPKPLEAEVTVQGDAPEVFCLSLAQGALTPRAAAATQPVLRLRCDLAAWRASIARLLPPLLDRLETHADGVQRTLQDAAPRGQRFVDGLAQMPGTVALCYTDDAGDAHTFEVALGTGVGPRTTVHLSDSDLQTLLSGDGGAARALRSRIRLEGDAAYVMRLLQLVA